MAKQHIITKDYAVLRGWSTDSKYTRPPNVMETAVNIMRLPDGTNSPRRGYQAVCTKIGGLGTSTYDCKDCGTQQLVINQDGNLYKQQYGTINISFSGISVSDFISYEIKVDSTLTSDIIPGDFDPYAIIPFEACVTDSIVMNVYNAAGATIFTQQFGKGFGVAFPYLISDLLIALNAISGVTATAVGDTSVPAACIYIQEKINIANGKSRTLNWSYMTQVNHTVTSTFYGLSANVASPDFEIASFAAFAQNIYICSKYDFPQKYDGQTVYRAGMPIGQTITAALTSSGSITATDLQYAITYEQLDNSGRIVEGEASPLSNAVSPAGQNVSLTIPTLIAGSGWNTNCAIVDGNQVGVNTILVNVNHTIKIGDNAFFIDSSGVTQTREVSAITANTITILGAAVNVTNNQVISNNLKINIYRQTGAGGILRLVKTIPNNSFATPITFIDSVAAGAEGRELDIPPRPNTPPPKTAYVVPFGTILCFGGDPINDDFIWYSEADNPEYVSPTNNFIVPANDDDVSGLGIAGSSLITFKDRSIYTISGDLINNQFTVDPVASGSNIGCSSHHSIAQVGGLLYFVFGTGVYTMNATTIFPTDKYGNPVPISLPIDQYFRSVPMDYDMSFRLKRSVAINYTFDNQYILFLPCEDDPEDSSGVKYANNNSQVLVFDYEGKNWYQWTNWNAAGGFAIIGNDLYFQDRTRPEAGNFNTNNYKQHRLYRETDYADHVSPIRVTIRTSWEALGQPRVRKKYIRAILLFDEVSNLFQNPEFEMSFRTFLNYINKNPDTQATVTTVRNAIPFSIAPFNWTTFAGYDDPFLVVPLKQGTAAKGLQIGLQMKKLNSSFKLQGFQLEIATDFRKTVAR